LIRPLLIAAALAATAGVAQAQPAATQQVVAPITAVGANLNISPKRVTFDRARRSATVYIYNQGQAAASFDISLVDRVMLPDGQIVAVADAKPEMKAVVDKLASAQAILQVSPRRATLAPGQGQTIRLRVAGAPDAAAPVEARSHLTITTIPPADTGLTAEQAAAGATNELRFQVNSVFGLSIPAIVRSGDLDVRAAIQNVHLETADVSPDGVAPPKRTQFVVFDVVRLGTNSLFGNIEIRPAGKKGDPIGLARGIGVYTEIDRRNVRIPLTRDVGAGEKLDITFTDDDTSPGKLLAQAGT
jgi:P pilus assembly chaperone PapD